MNQLIVLTLVAVLAAFVSAQTAPPAVAQTCVTSTNVTFCGQYLVYAVKNDTVANYNAADALANTQYQAALTKVTNSSQGCQTALATYYCQVNFPRCTTYTSFSAIARTRCSNVNSQCNVPNFPAGGFSGPNCVNNTQASVDGTFVCAPTTVTSLGAACISNVFDPNYSAGSAFSNMICPVNSLCNNTDSNPTCVKPSNIGDSCPTGVCYNGPLMGTTTLACLGGTCQYPGKRFGYKCNVNAECLSNNCTSGTCFESPVLGYCTANNQCRQNLYCDTFNNTCITVAGNNELCGQLQSNWSPVPCATGYTCVRGTNTTVSKCALNAVVGGICSVPVSAIVYDSPLCIATSYNAGGVYTCVNNICTNVVPAVLNELCNATRQCGVGLTCQWSSQTSGTCQTSTSVSCGNSAGSPQCNVNQVCNCPATGALGTCSPSTTSPLSACSTQVTALQTCLYNKCSTASTGFIFYDGNSCGNTNCLSETNSLVCCAKGAAGANFVAPNGTPANVCATPSPSPTPTTTGSGSTTPSPLSSSKKSSATTVAASFIAMIVAVVAFCL